MLQNICEKLLFSFAEFQQRISSLPTEKCLTHAAQNMKFCIKDFFSKCEQILSFLRIWSNSPNKSLMENFILWAVRWVSVLIRILTQYCFGRYYTGKLFTNLTTFISLLYLIFTHWTQEVKWEWAYIVFNSWTFCTWFPMTLINL